MITFKHNSLEKSTPKIIENIEVDDVWLIKTIKCTKGSISKKMRLPEIKMEENESSITYYFEVSLKNKLKPNIKLDLYIIDIVIVSPNRRFVRQRIRYYSLFGTEIFDTDEDIPILEHLKSSLTNKLLGKLFEYQLKNERRY